jgi:hypothetical protein
LNRGILDARLAAVLFIFLMGSVALINANQRAEANEAINATCSSCSSSDVRVLNATFLATALNSQDYLNVKKLFPETMYSSLISNATAQVAYLEFDGTRVEVLIVLVPFRVEAVLTGIIFSATRSAVLNQTMAMGAAVDLKTKAPVFLTVSVDGNVTHITIPQRSTCSSCRSHSLSGSGVVPLVDQCSYDGECVQMYGEGWCCIDYQCQPCPPPGEPSPCFWFCLWCIIESGIILYDCWPCFYPCLTVFLLGWCLLCLLTYCLLQSGVIIGIIAAASWLDSCLECAHCMGWI